MKRQRQRKKRDFPKMVISSAVIEDDYRYLLTRIWNRGQPFVAFIGLNPSTADGQCNDPTITRCINFAFDWGYGGIIMLNLFAYRATNPAEMMKQRDPIGIRNDFYIVQHAKRAGLVVGAWGKIINRNVGLEFKTFNNLAKDRARAVCELIPQNIYMLAENADKSPRHPLYVKAETKPRLYINRGVPATKPDAFQKPYQEFLEV